MADYENTYSCTLTAEDESNRFEIYSLYNYAHLIRDICSFIFAETISCSRIMGRFPVQVEHGLALLHVLVVDSH